MIYIQTDATINPGNSGGALVDTDERWSASTRSSSRSRAAAKGSASRRRATSSATSTIRSGRPGGCGAERSASTLRRITPLMAEALALTGRRGDGAVGCAPRKPGGESGPGCRGTSCCRSTASAMENGRQFRINVYTRGVGEQVAVELQRGSRTLTVRVPVVERASDVGQLEVLIGTQQVIAGWGARPRSGPRGVPLCCRRCGTTKAPSSRASPRRRRFPTGPPANGRRRPRAQRHGDRGGRGLEENQRPRSSPAPQRSSSSNGEAR